MFNESREFLKIRFLLIIFVYFIKVYILKFPRDSKISAMLFLIYRI